MNFFADTHIGHELMWLRNFIDGFQIAASINHGKHLARSIQPHRLNRDRVGRQGRSSLGT